MRHIAYNAADPIKAAAQRATELDNCGVASFIPVLIRNHCKGYKISVEKENPRGETVTRPNEEPRRSIKPTTGPSLQFEIRFYRSNDKPYGAFSNLFRRPIVFEGRGYPTAEHAYQAGKPRKEAVREWILSAPSPGLVAMAAHGLYTWDIVANWTEIKFDRMRSVLRAKFSQHEDLRALLLETGDARIVEASRTNNPVNRVWGEVNGKGLNMLGVLLMEIRAELQQANAALKHGRPKSDLHMHAVKDCLEDQPASKRRRSATA